MVLELLSERQTGDTSFAELLRPKGKTPGDEPEERVVFCGMSWEDYERIDEALGHDRPTPRLYYLNGELEIMTTSFKHELAKKWLALFIEEYLYQIDLPTIPHGQTTMKRFKEAGAEPDESWSFDEAKEFPDIVLEIVFTSGGVSKLDIYRRFGVTEVWFWQKGALEFWKLRADGSAYDRAKHSSFVPNLDVSILHRGLETMPHLNNARRFFSREIAKALKNQREK